MQAIFIGKKPNIARLSDSEKNYLKGMMTKTAALLGQHLKTLREKAKLSQDEAVEKAELHRRTLTKLEAGTSNPNLETLEALAKAYSCTLADIFSPWRGPESSNHSGHDPEAEVLCKRLKLIFQRDPERAESIKTLIDAVFRTLKK